MGLAMLDVLSANLSEPPTTMLLAPTLRVAPYSILVILESDPKESVSISANQGSKT